MLISTNDYNPNLKKDIPSGIYKVLIENAEFKNTASGNYRGLNLTYKIQEEEYQFETLFEWIASGFQKNGGNSNSNPKVVEWGLNKILKIAILLGIKGELNEERIKKEFEGMALYLDVVFDGSKEKYKNSIREHISLNLYKTEYAPQNGDNVNIPPSQELNIHSFFDPEDNHEIPPH